MKNLFRTLAALIFCASVAAAQVQLGGHVFVPSSTDSVGGLTVVNFTANGDCNVVAQTNCTLTTFTGSGSDASLPYTGTLVINDPSNLLRGPVNILVPLSPGRSYTVENDTAQALQVQSPALEGGVTVGVNGIVPVKSDGVFYNVEGCAATVPATGGFIPEFDGESYPCSMSASPLFDSGSAVTSSEPFDLPTGSTAVTQTTGDNSTNIATDAFVLSNAGGGPAGSVVIPYLLNTLLTPPNTAFNMQASTSTFDNLSFFYGVNITDIEIGGSYISGTIINSNAPYVFDEFYTPVSFPASGCRNFYANTVDTRGEGAGVKMASFCANGNAFLVPTSLPTGSTAVTQATGDNTTQIATDAFVLANASSGGSGTVTSVSGLSPLFTTSNATTTPTFTAINAAQNSVLAGPPSGGAGAYSFQTAPTISAANMTNFPTLNQNTTGTSANLSGTPALPNGTTATTQTTGDNTTKIATDAFVLANASGGAGIPTTPTNALVKINGSNGAASSITDNGTTVSTTEPLSANGITSNAVAGTAGIVAVSSGASNPTIPANQFGFLGFASGSATSYFLQPSVTAPAANQVMAVGSPSGGIVPLTYISNTTTVNGTPCTLGSTCTIAAGAPCATTSGAMQYNNAGSFGCAPETYNGSLFTASAPYINSTPGAASTPALQLTGTPYAGTDANSLGQLDMQWGTASSLTTLNTNGEAFTIRAPAGYTGDLCHFFTGTTAVFTCNANGSFIAASGVSAAYFTTGSTVGSFISPLEGNNLNETAAAYQFAGSSGVGLRVGMGGTNTSTLTANSNYANLVVGSSPVTTPATGTNAILANEAIATIGTVTSGGATLPLAANLFVDAPPTGATLNVSAYIKGPIATRAIDQNAASNTGGSCTMSASTTCAITLSTTYTTPVCVATLQGTSATADATGHSCSVSGATVTITAGTANSSTWGAFVFGNPN